MPDITMCVPKSVMPCCENCYRRNANPDTRQSYSDFWEFCCVDNGEDYYIPMEDK